MRWRLVITVEDEPDDPQFRMLLLSEWLRLASVLTEAGARVTPAIEHLPAVDIDDNGGAAQS